MQALEGVAAALSHKEAVLLTGETGTGKTSIVQHLASQVRLGSMLPSDGQLSNSGHFGHTNVW